MNPIARIASFAVCAAGLLLGACSKAPDTPATAPSSPAPAAASNVSDFDVTNHVTMALQQNDALKGFNIQVITLKGDVRLIGVLDTQPQIDQALQIARASEGAHTIHDELTLKK